MSDFVLTCESAADRTREFFASRNISVVCFHYEIDDVVYTDDLYQSITPDEFFAQIAAGAMPKTSQVSVGEYEEFWEPFVAEGKDVLLDRSVELPARRSHFGRERDHRHGAQDLPAYDGRLRR